MRDRTRRIRLCPPRDALAGDCSQEEVLKEIGVNNFDVVFVTMGASFQSSLEVSALAKDLGAKHVVSMSGSEIQSKFLLRNGADEVIYPQKDMALKTAVRYNAENIFDFIQLDNDNGIFELAIPEEWVGKDVVSANIRKEYNLNVLAVKKGGVETVLAIAGYVFAPQDHVIVAGSFKDVERLKK